MSMFGNLIPFGKSNANNSNQNAPVQTGKQQLEQPANNNQQIQTGNTGAADDLSGGQQIKNDGNQQEQGSQLDNYKDLFTIAVDDKGQPIQQPADPLAGPVMSLDADKLKAAAGKMNFAAGIQPEVLQKAMSGQDPEAFMQVLNAVAQNGFSSAITVTSKMAEEAIQKNNQRFEAALPDRIRNTQIRQQSSANPVLSHPAVAPVLEGLKATIAAKNPHLSPDKVQSHAEDYFMKMHADMNAHTQKTETATRNKSSEGTNWAELLDLN